ncbi:MAG: glycine--tRNA ligase subunit alpha [Buchnera aphidicola (Periphyllus lyropictus)]|nr:glycine--tRNA ligase subunit alpha [Buchnera aphidicola]NIH16704.1 glycine--tRNA ligase subunit alpha [Buchnera aphidicola (Periphyllus lyropictus)]USS94611.1 glycine--tRNA ligase subunit alpha [Buchnera aphidicola (Periphyllus lyropictus)]
MKKKEKTFFQIISNLKKFWNKIGCTIIQPIDIPVGAGTFHQKTFFSCINKKPIAYAYTQASRRPTDGRKGKNKNRLQHYYQFQVIIKPAPKNIQEIYLQSLSKLKIKFKHNDIKFIEDNWENPTLGASGIGWEVWLNGIEITQFTYFQQIGAINCDPISVEITYGLERLAMHIQNINNIYKIIWCKNKLSKTTYKEMFYKNEIEQSEYNLNISNKKFLFNNFKSYYSESKRLLSLKKILLIPSYEFILHSIHYFNLLDARGLISLTDRQYYILKIRKIVKKIAKIYYKRQI